MPSPRTSAAAASVRPNSPLSPSFKPASHFDSLQPPSPRQMHARTAHAAQRRAPNGSLKLPSLPRFHPANFPSAHSSLQSTPDGVTSPQPPVSPRAHQRMYSDAQKHLMAYQRDIVTAAARAVSPGQPGRPVSPRLAPLGSPGPVTPLELEGEEGYLVAGVRHTSAPTCETSELVERLINPEARNQRANHDASRHAER